MILILTEEDIIPHFRHELLSNIEIGHLRVSVFHIYNARTVVIKYGGYVKILKTMDSNLQGLVYPWSDTVKHLLEL